MVKCSDISPIVEVGVAGRGTAVEDRITLEDTIVEDGMMLDESVVEDGMMLEDSILEVGAMLEESVVEVGVMLEESVVEVEVMLGDSDTVAEAGVATAQKRNEGPCLRCAGIYLLNQCAPLHTTLAQWMKLLALTLHKAVSTIATFEYYIGVRSSKFTL